MWRGGSAHPRERGRGQHRRARGGERRHRCHKHRGEGRSTLPCRKRGLREGVAPVRELPSREDEGHGSGVGGGWEAEGLEDEDEIRSLYFSLFTVSFK